MTRQHSGPRAESPPRPLWLAVLTAVGFAGVLAATLAAGGSSGAATTSSGDGPTDQLIAQGRQTFRFDTFGDEDFWGGALGLDKAIEGAAHGGVGPGVSPKTALAVGL